MMRQTSIALLGLLLAACGAGPWDKPLSQPRLVAQTRRPTRTFHIRYEAYLRNVPTDQQLRLWIPLPSDDPAQQINNLVVKGLPDELPFIFTREKTYGNKLLYIEGRPRSSNFTVTVEYDVSRFEYRTDRQVFSADGELEDGQFARYLKASRLVVVNDRIRKLAAALSQGKTTRLDQARAFYEHIVKEMSYGKPAELPWGRGDTMFACDAKIGNCTDFHSYFISLCRAAGIPARFQIGLFGKYGAKQPLEYKTGGYHCWAEFHVAGKGWVPVDISEADKQFSKGTAASDIYFGYHTDNRVTLSIGRDLVLTPAQQGAPLNYLIHPYAEVGGKPFKVAKQGFWKDSLRGG